jgi:hypothetical protein
MIELNEVLVLPRGHIESKDSLQLEMSDIYKAEKRLGEIRSLRAGTAAEYMGFFNEAAAIAQRHMAAVQYEILVAKQKYDHRRAVVLIDLMPQKLKDLKDSGIKSSEDIRDAIITLDPVCSQYRDRIDCLTAVHTMLENKVKVFVRAYNAARSVIDSKIGTAAYRPLNSSGSFDAREFEEIDGILGDIKREE